MSGKSIGVALDDFMLSARVAIEGTMGDQEMLTVMAGFGYSGDRIAAAKVLLEQSQNLVNIQKKEYGEQFEASSDLDKLWTEADGAYMKSLKLSRIALQGHIKAHAALGINGPRNQSLSGWIQQAEAFYGNLKDDSALLAEMAKFGRSGDILKAEYDLVKKVVALDVKKKNEMGEAQQATEARDKKIDELSKWLSDFRAVAKVAFADSPQKLEKIGILARSGPKHTAKKKDETAASGTAN